MFKPHTVLGFGLWFIAVNYLFGIPAVWKIRLYVLTGLFFVFVYLYHLAKETIIRMARSEAGRGETFSENARHESSKEVMSDMKNSSQRS